MSKKVKRPSPLQPNPPQPAPSEHDPFITFPSEVVDGLRYFVARATRQTAFPARLSLVAALRQEGVTYLSRVLAAVLANDLQMRVCAVELNWLWPSQLPIGPRPGLAEVLTGQVTLAEALLPATPNSLAFLAAGDAPLAVRHSLAHSPRLAETLDQLGQQFDVLVLDVPAIRATSDALVLASLGQAGCLVVSQEIDSGTRNHITGMNTAVAAAPKWNTPRQSPPSLRMFAATMPPVMAPSG